MRELRNIIERNLILYSGRIFRGELPDLEQGSNRNGRRLDEVESEHLRSVLQSTRWRVRGKEGAADILGMKPTTLEARIKKLGIRRTSSTPNLLGHIQDVVPHQSTFFPLKLALPL